MSNRKVIDLVLHLKSAKAHGNNYIKVKPHLARHLLRNRLSKAGSQIANLKKKSTACTQEAKAENISNSFAFANFVVIVSIFIISGLLINDIIMN